MSKTDMRASDGPEDERGAHPSVPKVLVCSCDASMTLDVDTLAHAPVDVSPIFSQLCRTQIGGYEAALDEAGQSGRSLCVACTQEAPLFAEIAEERGQPAPKFVNIRERAGWCDAKGGASPKIAALLADALHEDTPAELSTLDSGGICLVYGRGQAAIDAGRRLSSRLSVTVVLSDVGDAMPDASGDVPVFTGRIARAGGVLGNFEVVVDGYAPMVPSSKDELIFMMPRNGASSKCDVIVDMSGGDPLFGSHERRDGYFRVDMAKPGALADALFDASDLVGTFEKPLYVRYDPGICAHGRSGKIGCSNCIDACPVSAITPNGDTVAIDHGVCGGCGNCSASCPTGAVSYAFPMRSDVISRVQTLVTTFHVAGGQDPIILLYDAAHGEPLIAACARYGQGLPAHVLPLSLYTTTHIGHDVMAGALASGAAHVVCLVSPQRRDEIATLEKEASLTHSVTSGLGDAQRRVHVAIEDDPDALRDMLDGLAPVAGLSARTFTATPQKRETARLALTALHEMSSGAPEVIALPEASPYGQIHIDTAGCTLCLACVSACPANALADNPERPQVAFTEAACVQCGLCKTTCPEKVITLEPRFNFSSAALSPRVLNEEEPFECISCGKPFGTKSTIERVMAALAGKHSMFRESEQARVIQMCDDCRVAAMSELEAPMASAPRPAVRTTEDYLRADENHGDTPGSDTA